MKAMLMRCIAAVMSAVAVFCLAMDAAACTAVLEGKDASLPHDLDDGDAAGRLERFFLPEPALR